MAKLTNETVTEKLKGFPAWSLDVESGKLVAGFEFENFTQATDFFNSIAAIADEVDHHPDMLLHDYRYVTLFTSTHDEDGITDKDFELIAEIEKVVGENASDEGEAHDPNDGQDHTGHNHN